MEYLLKVIFGKSTATGIAMVLFFTQPASHREGSRIIVSGELRGVITAKVERILRTGTEVRVTYYSSLIAETAGRERLMKARMVHSIRYDPLDREYRLDCDGRGFVSRSMEEAGRIAGRYRAEFSAPLPAERCVFYIEAEIDYQSALEIGHAGKALWDYRIPNMKARIRTGEGRQ